MALFQTSVLKNYLKQLDEKKLAKAYSKYAAYFQNTVIQENIRKNNEEQFQATFLNEFFVGILDYTLNPKPHFNLTTEFKNQKNNRKADGAILSKWNAIGVIELKGTNTKDLESIRRQAFDYKANQKGCVYVITSNFEKLRFYINDATEFEEFNLFELTPERFQLLYLCLQKDNLLQNIPLAIKESSLVEEEKITKRFYADYSLFKRELYRDLVKKNAKRLKNYRTTELQEISVGNVSEEEILRLEKNVKLALFKKSQKLIDRFLFVFFAEDRGLLPPNSTVQILEKWKADVDFGDERPLYDLFKQYFIYLDKGRQGTTSRAEIYAYNGGLFKPDSVLDSLEIDNDLLYGHALKLATYDFESQVDVNILGHIFENSLNEIESVNAEIEGADFDKQKSKRKKDGVFYTPKYITKYIVEHTVGKLCEEKKAELGFQEEEYFKGRAKRPKTKILELVQLLDVYRAWLLELKICDPACGSGAFLNQALDFLIKEHNYIDELKAKILGGGIVFSDIENTILENNIYGVDLNEESVEIAKLSLWLRTAQPRRKLNDLSSTIKCGNSLIADKKVAGHKAFHWQESFPKVFTEKDKKAFHITTAIHDSRTSQRMVDHKVRQKRAMGTKPFAAPQYLTAAEEQIITETLADIVKTDKLNIMAYNICKDHLHLLMVCAADEVSHIMQKVKSMTAKMANRHRTSGHDPSAEYTHTTRGHDPLAQHTHTTMGHDPLAKPHSVKKHTPLWTQKYGCKEITSEEQLSNTYNYIRHNRSKHELPEHPSKVKALIESFCTDQKTAFATEYEGGFDVVIGNPPYVRAELLSDFMGYFEKQFEVFHPASDLFAYFYELGASIINEKGLMGFISNTFDKTAAGKVLREYLTDTTRIKEYIDFTEVQIFEGATTYPVIIILDRKKETNNQFNYVKIPKSAQNRVIDIAEHECVRVAQQLLDSNSWSFLSAKKAKILLKLRQFSTVKQKFGKCYYGVKTALNDAFISDDKFPFGEHIKPIHEGKELKKWNV